MHDDKVKPHSLVPGDVVYWMKHSLTADEGKLAARYLGTLYCGKSLSQQQYSKSQTPDNRQIYQSQRVNYTTEEAESAEKFQTY